MNRIIYTLLTVVFFQLLGIGYIKFIDEKTILPLEQNSYSNDELEILINTSIKEILNASKKLPQSTEYTVWDKKTVEHLSQRVLKSTEHKVWDKINIENISQKILQESKINTITIVKENSIAFNKIENKKKMVQKTKYKKIKITKKKVIRKAKHIPITQKVEKYAKAKLGQKYVWGATGPNRFDCSGFTKYVFSSTAGIKIPRVSRDQAKVGKYIKYKDLRRGDMVFFDTEKKFIGKVNHVGIYLSNGNFIHASSARKKVIITNFRKKPFYKRRFLWGRRIIRSKS